MRLTLSKLLIALSACLLAGAIAQADSVTGDGSWQTWSASNLFQGSSPTPGIPYWNNGSGDGSRYNVGWCLTGGGNCVISSPPGNLPYLGHNDGGAPANIEFNGTGYAVTATLEATITNSGPLDTFGWYRINADGSIGSLTPLFSASQDAGTAPKTFMPGSHTYGFYIEQDQGLRGDPFSSQYFFFMNSAANSVAGFPNPSDNLQHFAVFNSASGPGNAFYIGAVDTRACGAGVTGTCDLPDRFDYNDFVVKLDTVNTPEPGSLGLLLGGLVLLAAFCRRSKRSVGIGHARSDVGMDGTGATARARVSL